NNTARRRLTPVHFNSLPGEVAMNGWLRSRTRLLAAAVFASMFAVATSGSAWAVTYYSQGSLAPNLVTSWNSIRGGGGLPPLNFTSGDVFVIQSPHNMGT